MPASTDNGTPVPCDSNGFPYASDMFIVAGVPSPEVQASVRLPDIAGLSRADAARAYMSAGIATFPCDGKMPTKVGNGRMKWSEESTTDLTKVDQWAKSIWFHAAETLVHRRGMAIDAGKSGVVVIDVDRPGLVPAEWWPVLSSAPFTSTDGGDQLRGHYYFAQPAEPVGCPKGEWGEVKGAGGYVILPPSPHASAHRDWPDNQTPEKKYRPTARYFQVRTGPLTALPSLIADTFGAHRAAKASASYEEVARFMEQCGGSREDADPKLLEQIIRRFLTAVEKGEGRHPSMVDALCWAAKAARGGLLSAVLAHDTLESVFAKVKGADAYPTEYGDMWEWAVGQATDEEVAEFLVRRAEKDALRQQPEPVAAEEEAWVRELIDSPQIAVPEQRTDARQTVIHSNGTAAPAPQGEETEEPQIVFRRASQVRVRRTLWMWDTTAEGAAPTSGGRIPKDMLTMAAGLPGTGKSQWAIWMTAQITRGTLPGSEYGTPRNVIYAATEDDWERTIAPRLIAADADLDRVFHVKVRTIEMKTVNVTVPLHHKIIGQWAQEHDVALLVLDPLLSHLGGKINANNEAEVRAALEPLVQAAARYEFTVLGLSHFNKNTGDADPLNRLMGSRGFSALLRALIVFAKDKDAEAEETTEVRYVLSQAKNNLGRTDMPSYAYTIAPYTVETDEGDAYVSRFVLGPETETSVEAQMVNAGRTPEDRELAKDCEMWLHAFLMEDGGEASTIDIKKAYEKEGYSRSAIYRAKAHLKVTSSQVGFGDSKISMWKLPGA